MTLVAAPEFFTATLMVLVFVLALGIGNAVIIGSIEGMGVFELIGHFALPIAALCFVIASQMIRNLIVDDISAHAGGKLSERI